MGKPEVSPSASAPIPYWADVIEGACKRPKSVSFPIKREPTHPTIIAIALTEEFSESTSPGGGDGAGGAWGLMALGTMG